MESKLRHSWIKLSGKKQRCTRCSITKEFLNTPARWIYELNGKEFKTLPNCK
jgi:hypothetical protein